MKIVNDLARQGVLETTRGRGGGLRLLRAPTDIRVGDVVRSSETDFRLVECFDPRTNTCSLTPSCRSKGAFHAALQAYFKELDAFTLANIAGPVPPVNGTDTAPRRAKSIVPIRAPLTRPRAPGKFGA